MRCQSFTLQRNLCTLAGVVENIQLFCTSGARSVSVEEGPDATIVNLEAIKAPTVPTNRGEPSTNEQENKLSGSQGHPKVVVVTSVNVSRTLFCLLYTQVGETLWISTKDVWS
eukprot:CFRG5363T1